MRKTIAALSLAVLIFATSLTTAHAAHGSRHNNTRSTEYSICATINCTKTELHKHNGKTYAPHSYGDGHDYHEYCDVENCSRTGYHSHDGTYCFGHTINDGHDYHDYCNITNCKTTGYHQHNGAYCFGHTTNNHNNHRTPSCCYRQ